MRDTRDTISGSRSLARFTGCRQPFHLDSGLGLLSGLGKILEAILVMHDWLLGFVAVNVCRASRGVRCKVVGHLHLQSSMSIIAT